MPGRRVAFDQEGAHRRAVAVVVRDPDAMLVGAERERQAVERLGRAIPGELVGEPLDARLELALERAPDHRVEPVRAYDQIRLAQLRERRDLPAVRRLDAGVAA